jgi:hypothetical protein
LRANKTVHKLIFQRRGKLRGRASHREAQAGPRGGVGDVEEREMPYRSPVGDILFSLNAVADLPGMIGHGLAGDLDWDAVSSIVGEAGRFATEEIAPLNRPGDLAGAVVTMPFS